MATASTLTAGPRLRAVNRVARWQRRAVALVVAALGVVDLVLAASTRVGLRAAVLRADYSPGTVVGGRYLLLFAGLGCLLLVRPLLHGKRVAWWLGLVAAVGSLVGHHVRFSELLGLTPAVLAVALLLATRAAFVARPDPQLFRRGWSVLLGGELLVLAYGAVGLYLLDPEFREPIGVPAALRDGVRLLFLLPSVAEPVTPHGRFFVESVRVAALGVALLGVGRLLSTVTGTPGHQRDRRQVQALLGQYATTSLAHFQLLDDKAWVFSADRRALVGYTVVGTTSVALGDPVGAPDARPAAVRAFLELCALNGWSCAFHQVTPAGLPALRAAGMRALTIGEEAVVDLRTWTDEGKANKSLRSALRRCERAGYRVVTLTHPLTAVDLERLREVSDSWLAAGGHRERTFTLGRFDAGQLRATPVLAVVDAEDTVQAFANLLPSYRSEEGSFDLMRRRPGSVNGVMDQLFVALIRHFRAEGRTGMNLGLAPFSGEGDPTLTGRALRQLYEHGGAAFNFSGLREFKDKWSPRWEPRSLVYIAETDLPRVALAVTRAGELPDPRGLPARTAAVLATYPGTVAMLGLQLWLSVVGALHPQVHAQLLRHYGLAWQDLTSLQLWRVLTPPLIPPRAGFVWGNLLLVAVVLPLAERRLGLRRTILAFFAGDALSTLPVLVVLRLAAAAGSVRAAGLAHTQDGGLSSGTIGVLALVALSLSGRVRQAALAALFSVLVVLLVAQRQLDTAQHVLAALVVLGVTVVGRRLPGRLWSQPLEDLPRE